MEASIVLPLLILIIAAMIQITSYHYDLLKTQCQLRGQLSAEIEGEWSLVKKIEVEGECSRNITFFNLGNFGRNLRMHGYVLDEGMIVRGGKLVI